ncbi:MAG: XdhC family protein [Kineosporiaceae bacterium]
MGDGTQRAAECEVAHGHDEAGPGPVGAGGDRVVVAVYAGAVAGALLRIAAECGFRTVLVEPDASLPAPDGLPTATVRVAAVPEASSDLLDRADVVVCDHHRDDLGVPLRDALASPARWVGIMGSPRHEPPHVPALAALGVPPEEIARVHRPIGLDIGSRTPAEIAVSTLAGLLADRNGRPGGPYRAPVGDREPERAT